MALIETHFFSTSLCFGTDLNVFIPTPNVDELMEEDGYQYYHPGAKFQVLYLLHGGYGDYTDWMRLTSIERYAQAHKLAVIMPSASNSFYQDMAYGSDYLTYIADELPRFCRKIFPISTRQENTFIGGLSMGGYGALRVALEHPEQYSRVISLSGGVDAAAAIKVTGTSERKNAINPYTGERKPPIDPIAAFGTENIEGTDADLYTLIAKRKTEGVDLPPLFQSVGTEDFIYPGNVSAHKKFVELGLDVTYEEHPGIHNWEYWDTHIQRALNWLPLAGHSVEE